MPSYWIYKTGAPDADGGAAARQVFCQDGSAASGDGQSADNIGKDCDTLINVFDEDAYVNNTARLFWLPLSTSTNVALAGGAFPAGGEPYSWT